MSDNVSKLFEYFKEQVIHNENTTEDFEITKMLDDKNTNPIIKKKEGDILYRCRIIKKENINNKEIGRAKINDFYGFDESGSGAPPLNADVEEGRANRKGEIVLYCAESEYIAISEVKPKVGSLVSIAQLKVVDKLNILDLTGKSQNNGNGNKNELFKEISKMFSKPISFVEDKSDYKPSQYLSKHIKSLGYDGFRYESSIAPEVYAEKMDEFGYNIAIFNFEKVKPIRSAVIEVKHCNIDFNLYDTYDKSSSWVRLNNPNSIKLDSIEEDLRAI